MTTQPEQPSNGVAEEAEKAFATEAKPAAPAAKSVDTDDVPITPSEVGELLVKEAIHMRDSLLVPLWRLGRRYMRSFEDGVDTVAEGLRKKKDGE